MSEQYELYPPLHPNAVDHEWRRVGDSTLHCYCGAKLYSNEDYEYEFMIEEGK